MKILSLFDGISVAQQAFKELGIEVEKYYASEVDKYAISITQKNFPNTIQLGDVKDLVIFHEDYLKGIDFFIGGSPCQDLSIAKKNREGLKGARSGLFYEYVRILKEVKPKYFILENVNSMPKEAKEQISEILGVEPIMINASLVSAQQRKRLFWVGKLVNGKYEKVEIPQPEDNGILLKDILEDEVDEKYYVNISDKYGFKGLCDKNEKGKSMTASMYKGYGNDGVTTVRVGSLNSGGQGDRIYSKDGKSVSLSANGGGRGAKTGLYRIEKEPHGTALDYYNDTIVPKGKAKVLGTNPQSTTAVAGQLVNDNSIIRKLTPIECERLQSLPDNFTLCQHPVSPKRMMSNTQRYKALGNAFNCEVIKHILKNLI